MTPFTALLIGDQSLTRACGEMWLARGHRLECVVTDAADVAAWAHAQGLPVVAPGPGLADRLAGMRLDWLLSVANLRVLPKAILALAARGAVNFHDGPLPRHAGLNAPVWALLEGEATHGITWHLIGDGIDDGDILEQRLFDIAPDETALSLNAACFAAGVDSFPALMTELEAGMPGRRLQNATARTLHLRDDRPAAFGRVDFTGSAEAVVRHVLALDHGGTWNPLATAKVLVDGQLLHVGGAEAVAGSGAPGTVLQATREALVVACGTGAVRLTGLVGGAGRTVDCARMGSEHLPSPDAETVARLAPVAAALARTEPAMRRALATLHPVDRPMSGGEPGRATVRHPLTLPDSADPAQRLARLGLAALRLAGQGAGDLALALASDADGYASGWSPVRIAASGSIAEATALTQAELAQARVAGGFATDLPLRDPGLRGLTMPPVALSDRDAAMPGAQVTLTPEAIFAGEDQAALAARLSSLVTEMATDPERDIATLPLVTPSEAAQLATWNATGAAYDPNLCLHHAFEAQVARMPLAPALAFEGQVLSYADLNARANRAAHVLIAMGVGPGMPVGLCTARGVDMVAGALAILKAGGAYVPMDPAYPADRLALFAADSGVAVIVTQGALVGGLPAGSAQVLCLDTDPRLADAPGTNPDAGAMGADLAYVIYTSGSTGRPKGVMVEHRNVAAFFAGMDATLGATPPGVWLAVTSLSFDISVLELFWTLARGFKVVIAGDDSRRMAVAAPVLTSARGMEFSLYYWGSDDRAGPGKYDLLLEGAKFADAHGFTAVWTPERHFHAFGGLYPNPSVTGAAVAAVTRNLAVRAGSCVAPLHHPARIAEEWAVIDNLTGGRSGLAMASGWQPDDFVLRPENTPPANRKALFDTIDQVRRLWRGEAVAFPTATGTHSVVTQPRPLSKELAVWVTTAGNPETWREAGAIGANVLTHLLGQTVDEVAGKIALYHAALRAAGHDPGAHRVTLMLHTCLADSREAARDLARGPMIEYLRSAAGLIKQYAWAFPAFKKPQGVANPAEIDLQSLDPKEMDAILAFAFERYFEDSGLFGTVEDALARVEALKAIGVDEVACLIDYGIATDAVLAGLRPLAQVLRRANLGTKAEDHSIAAEIVRHGVTHLQCTPSMARMLAADPGARAALAGVGTLLLGGEALPGALVADLRCATPARILNMYGPTETTIWSSTALADSTQAVCGIGAPIANTALHVLDRTGAQVPPGMEGELWIGGAGVARGYWQRDDLTAERFLPDPFAGGEARMYRTGDLVRRRGDGALDFLGRADAQVKVRGHRIEPGEIEAVLEAQPGVTQALVLAREDQPGDLRLVAYVTGGAPEVVLRAALDAALPAHMRPAQYVALRAFPLTPNRKVDRNALPAPHHSALHPAVPPVLSAVPAAADPQAGGVAGGVGARIAEVWQRILGVPSVGPRDNFFALGGHSLLAVQAHREIRAALATVPSAGGLTLSITDIFRFPTLGALTAHLEGQVADMTLAPDAPAPTEDRADARTDAMERRRAMRAARAG